MIRCGIGATGWGKGGSSPCNYVIVLTSPCISWNFLDKRNIFQAEVMAVQHQGWDIWNSRHFWWECFRNLFCCLGGSRGTWLLALVPTGPQPAGAWLWGVVTWMGCFIHFTMVLGLYWPNISVYGGKCAGLWAAWIRLLGIRPWFFFFFFLKCCLSFPFSSKFILVKGHMRERYVIRRDKQARK